MGRDEGTTLIEVMVGMVLMSIFLAMFTGAVVLMNRAMNNAQAVNQSASQLNAAFLSLDKTVRYAAAISAPGKEGKGNWYVEMRTTATSKAGTEECTQFRVDSQQLQRRTWTVDNSFPSKPTDWMPIASDISNGDVEPGTPAAPFQVPARAGAVLQQLTITLQSSSGSGTSLTNSTSSFTFTAVNSTMAAPTTSICQQWGRP